MKLSGKKIMSIALIGLLCVSIYLNWGYNTKDNNDSAKILGEAAYVNNNVIIEEQDEFSKSRIDRQKSREYSLELIEEILNDETADSETKKNAQQEKLRISKAITQEADSEAILKGKGFENVLISIDGDSANVLVKAESIIPAELAQIQEVVSSYSGISPEKIKIILSR